MALHRPFEPAGETGKVGFGGLWPVRQHIENGRFSETTNWAHFRLRLLHFDELKTAAELVEKAAALVREAAKETSLPSEAARQFVREHVVRIRLKLMLLRRDLTILHDTANRRKPKGSGKTTQA